MKYINRFTVVPFLLGIGASIVGSKALKSKAVHDCAVRTVAKALTIRDEAARTVSKVREEAEDIYAEAKTQKSAAEATDLVENA